MAGSALEFRRLQIRHLLARYPYINSLEQCRERREQEQCDDVRDFDHWVDRGTRSVFIRVADRVAGDRRLVRVRALAAVIAVLDMLLRIVPRTTTRGHRDRDEEPRHDDAEEHRAERSKRRRLPCYRV